MRVLEVVPAGTGVCLIRFVGTHLRFLPGQYLLVHDAGETKSYSISSPPSEQRFIELCVKDAGPVSHRLCTLQKGMELEFSGPIGRFTLQDRVENPLLFAATGTGISALRPMIATLFERGTTQPVFLFYGARAQEDLAYKEEFQKLARLHVNFRFIPVISRDPAYPGEKGHVQEVIPKYVPQPGQADVYICGVVRMVEEALAWAQAFGFPQEKIHYEKYL